MSHSFVKTVHQNQIIQLFVSLLLRNRNIIIVFDMVYSCLHRSRKCLVLADGGLYGLGPCKNETKQKSHK